MYKATGRTSYFYGMLKNEKNIKARYIIPYTYTLKKMATVQCNQKTENRRMKLYNMKTDYLTQTSNSRLGQMYKNTSTSNNNQRYKIQKNENAK